MVDKKSSLKPILRIVIIPISLIVIISLLADNLAKTNPHVLFDISFILAIIFIYYYMALSIFHLINKAIKSEQNRKLAFVIEVYLVSLSVLILSLLYVPLFNNKMFYVKQIVVYANLAFMIIYLAVNLKNYLVNQIQNQVKKVRLIKGFIFFMVCLTLTLLSQLQIYYLKSYVIPPLYSCSYYDFYNNLIYNSQYEGSCPELENVEKNENELSFSVKESVIWDQKEKDQKQKYILESKVYYKYDSFNRIIEYKIENNNQLYIRDKNVNPDYFLWENRIYTNHIINTYEANKITSIHHKNKISTQNNEKDSWHSYSSTVQYTSILSKIKDKQYTITIDKIIDGIEIESTNINVYLYDNERYEHIIHSELDGINDMQLLQRYGYNGNEIQKSYSKSLNSKFHKYLNYFNGAYIYNYEKSIYSKDFFTISTDEHTFDTTFEEKPYGFILKHYIHDKNDKGKFKQYNRTVESFNPGYKHNLISYPIESFHNYNLTQDSTPLEFIYQKNPLLFEEQFNLD